MWRECGNEDREQAKRSLPSGDPEHSVPEGHSKSQGPELGRRLLSSNQRMPAQVASASSTRGNEGGGLPKSSGNDRQIMQQFGEQIGWPVS